MIGSILIDADCMRSVSCNLRPEDFYLPPNRAVYEALLSMSAGGTPIDGLTVADHLCATAPAVFESQTQMRGYLAQLMEITPTSANVMEYVKIVREKAVLRKIASAANALLESVSAGSVASDVVRMAAKQAESMQSAVDAYQTGLWDESGAKLPRGLLNIAEVELVSSADAHHVRSGIPGLDQLIGGFYVGQLSIWTGRRGDGKSTILGMSALSALKNGDSVCLYSGELPAQQVKEWIYLQAAGPKNVVEEQTDVGKVVYRVRPEIAKQIDLWCDQRLILYDNGIANANSPDTILGLFQAACQQCGCTVFIVDNLMTADLEGSDDFYRLQSKYVKQLAAFAKKHSVHVHLVAHPRKGDGRGAKSISCDDVGGSGDITNAGDNTFSLERTEETDAPHSAKLSILKNRQFGVRNVSLPLDFDIPSRRYYLGNPCFLCGWEKDTVQEKQLEIQPAQDFYELTNDDEDLPF